VAHILVPADLSTKLYDRTTDAITIDKVEKIVI